MKKQKKIFNLIFILTVIFSLFIFTKDSGMKSFAQDTQTPAVQTTAPEKTVVVNKDIAVPKSIPEKNAYGLKHMEKTGFKYGIFKFFTGMFGVLVSSLAIFLGLKWYKKYILKNNEKLDNIDYDKTLESPKDFKEAINLFLDKTDK